MYNKNCPSTWWTVFYFKLTTWIIMSRLKSFSAIHCQFKNLSVFRKTSTNYVFIRIEIPGRFL